MRYLAAAANPSVSSQTSIRLFFRTDMNTPSFLRVQRCVGGGVPWSCGCAIEVIGDPRRGRIELVWVEFRRATLVGRSSASVLHEKRQVRVIEHISRHAAKESFAPLAMSVGTHHDQVCAKVVRLEQELFADGPLPLHRVSLR